MGILDDIALTASALEAHRQRALAGDGPVIRQPLLASLSAALDLARHISAGGLTGGALAAFLERYLAASTRLHHPGYMAHQVSVPHTHAALAGLIDASINNPMAIYEMGPAAAAVEFAVVNWMLEKAGWTPAPYPSATRPATATPPGGGVLTHGGSLANLTALAAARASAAPRAWEEGTPQNLVIVAPAACHYSIERASAILGLGRRGVRHPPAMPDGRTDPSLLAPYLQKLRSEGLKPMAVVANACSTALGLYDPIRAISEACRSEGVWLHIDGAHGASALVSARHRGLLDGLELADSLVWDAHKMLRSSGLAAAVLVRDHRDLDRAFREDASYLFHDKDEPGLDFIHRTVECTKAALGLKIFMVLAAEGEAGIAAFIDRQYALAREAAAYLRAEPGIEVAAEPQSNIVCFRFAGSDDRQMQLRRLLVETGRHYVSMAEVFGRRWLRLALMSPATTMDTIASLISEARAHLALLG